MDARLRILRHKLRYLWLGLGAAVIVCLLAFFLLNLSFRDTSGAFDKAEMKYTLTPAVGAGEIGHLEIHGNNIKIEAGMASGLKHLTVGLYGEKYQKEKVRVDIADNRIVVNAPQLKDKKSQLTMRVMIPEDSLRDLLVEGDQLDVDLNHIRADQVTVLSEEGDLQFADINANRLRVDAPKSAIWAEDNFITQILLLAGSKDIVLRHNKVKLFEATTDSGDVFLYDNTWRGQYRIQSVDGNITAVSRRLPWSLMIDARAQGSGDVAMKYDRRFWKKPEVVESDVKTWFGSVGNNPSNALVLYTEDGHITIQKRERYTDTHEKTEL